MKLKREDLQNPGEKKKPGHFGLGFVKKGSFWRNYNQREAKKKKTKPIVGVKKKWG